MEVVTDPSDRVDHDVTPSKDTDAPGDEYDEELRSGALKRQPRGAMIDWTAVLATLPHRFTPDSLLAHETAGEKPRAYHSK